MLRLAEHIARDLEPADLLLDQLHDGRMTRAEYGQVLPNQHIRFTRIASTLATLQRGIDAAARSRRARIQRIHATGVVLTAAGAALAILALAALARVSVRRRQLAEREQSARMVLELAHQEAERRRQALDGLRASRTRLIRGFAHDLKNPLGAADGYLFMLQRGVRGEMNEGQQQAVDRSRQALKGAMDLIEDVLELARTETGDVDLKPAAIDLGEIASRVCEEYRAQADAKGLAMTVEVPPDLPAVHADRERVAQILGNLLSNAIKYTGSGLVAIRVGTRRGDDHMACGVVDVIDTGPGIPEEHQARIFDEFERLRQDEAVQGAGIGLAISQRVAALLGGRITVTSEPRRGTAFTLWLPLA